MDRRSGGIAGVMACGLLLLCATPGAGQRVRAVTLSLDNDILAPRGSGAPPDFDYTHGFSLVAELGPEACSGCRVTHVGAGQRIYTPRRDAPEPIRGERPYAAWLYASAGLEARGARRERSIVVEAGVTGKPALGEPVQNGVHRLLGSERQEGWAHQLAFEPGVLLRYREGYPLERGVARLVPAWSVSLGNVRTAAELGGALRLVRRQSAGPYVEMAARHEWIARDLFLDGNTFRDNSSARRHRRVGEGAVAAGYRARTWAAEYRAVLRGREYRAQPEAHAYGSLTLTLLRGGTTTGDRAAARRPREQ